MRYLFLLLLFCCGCTSSWVTQQNHPFRGGVVKYLNAGATSVINSRRQDAVAKIEQYCGHSDYSILRESADSAMTGYYASYGDSSAMMFPVSSEYLHIAFSCEPIESPKAISKEEVLEKAKKCQTKGGIWVNDSCQIDIQ